MKYFLWSICVLLGTFSCIHKNTPSPSHNESVPTPVTVSTEKPIKDEPIIVGAERTYAYFPQLEGKKIALVVNHTSFIKETHLVDSLLSAGMNVKTIFAPEHGFRGKADAGATVKNGRDSRTGLPIVSLYGKNKKPTAKQLQGIDIVVFDIQDVGARFYTYISTMHYVMEACAELNIPFLVLDRPNPNGHYVDGYVLNPRFKSFVGMHPIPVVHGLTVAELALMINGEGWLHNGIQSNLSFVACANYHHQKFYSLPIPPSPNLPNDRAIALYPSLCFFEGTKANVGRGTTRQFQVVGHPKYPNKTFSYTPVSRLGATRPKFENKTCYGVDLTTLNVDNIRKEQQLNLNYLLDFYNKTDVPHFILSSKFIDLLAGTDRLRKDLERGASLKEIRATWKDEVETFKVLRAKYLIYEE